MTKTVKGYKVFNPDWTCRGFKYEVGKTFEEDVTPSCCNKGFHFCKELRDCFSYYQFNPENKVAEIIALGVIDEGTDNTKCCTNKIKIVKELTWEEVLHLVNVGKGNTGFNNSGDCNSGNRNSGDCNSGNRNSGDCNSGNRNSGDWNNGNRNNGDCNNGNRNNGDCNNGDYNKGDCNNGDYNKGDCNNGNWNSGDYNKTNYSSGCFNTKEATILMFDKPSDWTFKDWLNSQARLILCSLPRDVLKWICSKDMTDEEKEAHPEHETTGGYLKVIAESSCAQAWWNGLSNKKKNIIKALPNFDKGIFKQITGIDIDK